MQLREMEQMLVADNTAWESDRTGGAAAAGGAVLSLNSAKPNGSAAEAALPAGAGAGGAPPCRVNSSATGSCIRVQTAG